jgi:ribonuclease J
MGIPEDNIAVIENGTVLTFADERLEIGERVPGGYVYVDGARVGELGPRVMREREALGENGFMTAIVRYDRQSGRTAGEPRILTRGFVYTPQAEDLLARAVDVVRSAASVKAGTTPEEVEERVERALSRFLYQETRRHPVVMSVVMEG